MGEREKGESAMEREAGMEESGGVVLLL